MSNNHSSSSTQQGSALAKAITGRWDSIDIPDHLRYREPRPTISFAGVQSRYRSPPKRVVHYDPLEVEKERSAAARPPPNPMFSNVEPRYRSPPKSPIQRPRPEEEPLPRHVSVRPTAEYAAHKESSATFQHVPSKYFDIYTTRTAEADNATRRDEVEERRRALKQQIAREGRIFSPVIGRNRSPTFGEPPMPPPAKKKGGHSVVMEWVKHGIPIPTDRVPLPVKDRREAQLHRMAPFFAAGGAGGGSFARRNTSPTRPAAALEERVVAHVKERLVHPPRASSELVKRLSTPRTVSPTRVSPSREPSASSVRRGGGAHTAAGRESLLRRVHTDQSSAATSSAAPKPVISPRRVVRSVEPASLRRDRLDVGSATPPSALRDVDVQISAVSDLSELNDTPRLIHAAGGRQAFTFQNVPQLASP